MHEMSKDSSTGQFPASHGQREAPSPVALPGMPQARGQGIPGAQAASDGELGTGPDHATTGGSMQYPAGEQGHLRIRQKWYRFIYRSTILIGILPRVPDQYHSFSEGYNPGGFCNWDVRGPFDSEEEAKQDGCKEG